MIVSEFSLVCEQCLEAFWHEGSAEFDASLFSWSNIRNLARAEGWKRLGSRDGSGLVLRTRAISALRRSRRPGRTRRKW